MRRESNRTSAKISCIQTQALLTRAPSRRPMFLRPGYVYTPRVSWDGSRFPETPVLCPAGVGPSINNKVAPSEFKKPWLFASPRYCCKVGTHEVELSEEVLAPPDPRGAPAPPAAIAAGEAARAVVAGGTRTPDGPDDDHAHFR